MRWVRESSSHPAHLVLAPQASRGVCGYWFPGNTPWGAEEADGDTSYVCGSCDGFMLALENLVRDYQADRLGHAR